MKKKFLVLISCLLCCILFVAGCGVKPLVGGPEKEASVYGNGGMVVRKGEYVYFANAYSSATEITTNQNKYGDETLSAIYRVKLSDNGVVEYSEDGLPVGAEIMVKQISGFEDSGIYIFGEHLYYATPYTLKDSETGEDITGLIRFCRVNLDGTGWKVIYETKKFDTTASYYFAQVDGVVYLNIYDGEKVIAVRVKGGNISSKVVAEGVKSAVAYEREDITTEDTLCEYDRYVYYTRDVNKEKDGKETGTVVARIKYTDSKAKEEVLYVGENAYTVYEIKNNRLYLKLDKAIFSTNKTEKFEEEDLKGYYLNSDIVGDTLLVVEDINANQTNVEGVIYENREDKGVIAVWNNNMIIHFKGGSEKVVLYDASETELTLKLLYVEDGYVYYTEGGETLYKKSISKLEEDAEVVVTNLKLTVGESEDNYFDYDGDYVFFYKTVADTNEINSYLYMAKAGNGYVDADDKNIGKYIGVLDTEDTEEKKEENPDQEEVVK